MTPKMFIDTRPSLRNEVGIGVVFFVNPRDLRKVGLDSPAKLDELVEMLVNEQFALVRPQLLEAIKEYVKVDQTYIDKTRT